MYQQNLQISTFLRLGFGSFWKDMIGDEKIKEETVDSDYDSSQNSSTDGNIMIKQEEIEINSEGYRSQSQDDFDSKLVVFSTEHF